jgi:hypothetical protein
MMAAAVASAIRKGSAAGDAISKNGLIVAPGDLRSSAPWPK